jgi:hypothetical protein
LTAKAIGDVNVRQVRRMLRAQKIDLAARKSWCQRNDPEFAAKAAEGAVCWPSDRRPFLVHPGHARRAMTAYRRFSPLPDETGPESLASIRSGTHIM